MSSFLPRFAPAARGGLAVLLLAVPFLLGADDDYLREIEIEAKRQAAVLMTNPQQSTATAVPSTPDAKTDRLEAELDPAAFEQALAIKLPGTYLVYQQLDVNRKRQVYQAYQNDNKLTSISEQVARLRSAKP